MNEDKKIRDCQQKILIKGKKITSSFSLALRDYNE